MRLKNKSKTAVKKENSAKSLKQTKNRINKEYINYQEVNKTRTAQQ